MPAYKSKFSAPSKTHPGVTITVLRPSFGRRERLREKVETLINDMIATEALIEKTRESLGFHDEMSPDEMNAFYEKLPAGDAAKLNELAVKYANLRRTRDIEYARVGFVAIEGYDLDGNTSPNIHDLIEAGEEKLYMEITNLVMAEFTLSDAEREAFELASTSGGQEDGSQKNTSVTAAESSETSRAETAPSTTQS